MAKNTTADVIIDGIPLDEIITGDLQTPMELENLKKDAMLSKLAFPQVLATSNNPSSFLIHKIMWLNLLLASHFTSIQIKPSETAVKMLSLCVGI